MLRSLPEPSWRYQRRKRAAPGRSPSRQGTVALTLAPLEKANQAAPLKVSEVQMLHDALESSQDIWERVAAGAFLFCIDSRARWSDFIHGHSIELDTLEDGDIAYAEMHVSVHKTMFSSARRFRFLNLVAPGRGIHGGDWVRCWLDSLRAVGINPYDPEHGCLMPAPDTYGHPLKRAVETEEAGAWLRLLIGEHVNKAESTRPISSHSLKSTMLSFASKRGISHQDRLSLGHHSHPFKMADVYCRPPPHTMCPTAFLAPTLTAKTCFICTQPQNAFFLAQLVLQGNRANGKKSLPGRVLGPKKGTKMVPNSGSFQEEFFLLSGQKKSQKLDRALP